MSFENYIRYEDVDDADTRVRRTMPTTTDKPIEEIRRRASAASDGPWNYDHVGGFIAQHKTQCVLVQFWSKQEDDFPNSKANGRFIAHARTDIDFLLAEVDRLKAALEDERER